MNILIESTVVRDAEFRAVSGVAAWGILMVPLEGDVELRVRVDDPIRGGDLARSMRRGSTVRARGHRAWPRTDHATVAVLVGDVETLAVDGAEVVL